MKQLLHRLIILLYHNLLPRISSSTPRPHVRAGYYRKASPI